MKIDVTMTATLRKSIVTKTLLSFRRMFTQDHDYTLYINIDPIGEDILPEEIYLIAKQYFNKVVPNYPKTHGFCTAFKWCIENTTSDVVFHLEDDWELIRPFNINSLVHIMDIHSHSLGSIRLNRGFVILRDMHTIDLKTSMGDQVEKIGMINNLFRLGYVLHPDVSFNPGLFNGDYIRKVSAQLIPPKNPEDQFLQMYHNKEWDKIPNLAHAIYVGDGFDIVTRDIGRKWMAESKYKKPDSGFVFWKERKS